MYYVKVKFDPSIVVSVDDSSILEKYNKYGAITPVYSESDGIKYLDGLSLMSTKFDRDEFSSYFIEFASEYSNYQGESSVPSVDFEVKQVLIESNSGSDGTVNLMAYSYSFVIKFDPVYTQMGESVPSLDDMSQTAAKLIQNLKGNKLVVKSFEFEGTPFAVSGAKGEFVNVLDCEPESFKDYVIGLLNYVFLNMNETSSTFNFNLFKVTGFSYNVTDTKPADTVPNTIVVKDNSIVTVEAYIKSTGNKSVNELDRTKLSSGILDEIKKQLVKQGANLQWEVYIDSFNFEVKDDKNAVIKVDLSFKVKTGISNPDPIILKDTVDSGVSGAFTTVIILSLILAIIIGTAYIVDKIVMSLKEGVIPKDVVPTVSDIKIILVLVFAVLLFVFILYVIKNLT